jgi:hypothetical protein
MDTPTDWHTHSINPDGAHDERLTPA